MSQEHSRRGPSYDRRTADLLIHRLTPEQLSQLVDVKEFANIQDKILRVLQKVNDLSLESFGRVHSQSNGCRINKVSTGEGLRIEVINSGEDNYLKDVSLLTFKCEVHDRQSMVFYDFGGRHEGPFTDE